MPEMVVLFGMQLLKASFSPETLHQNGATTAFLQNTHATHSGGPRRGLIEVCDAESNWQLGANYSCAEGCHLGDTVYEDSHGVLQGDTAFCQCSRARDSADSGSLTGGILADNSFDVAVREGVASNRH